MIAGLLAALKGGALWSRAGALAARAGRWLEGDFWRVAALLAVLACGVLMLRIEGLHITFHAGSFQFRFIHFDGLKDRAERAEAALQAARKAAAEARAAQAAANHQPAHISRAIAEASDAQSNEYYEKGRAAAAAYAAANSVRSACPEGGTGGPGLSGADRATAQHDSPGDLTEMVALSRADFDQLTGYGLRLAQVHQDAQALIDAGVAAALEDEPPPDPAGTPLH